MDIATDSIRRVKEKNTEPQCCEDPRAGDFSSDAMCCNKKQLENQEQPSDSAESEVHQCVREFNRMKGFVTSAVDHDKYRHMCADTNPS